MNPDLRPYFDCLKHRRTPDEAARRRFTEDEDSCLGLDRNPYRLDAEQKIMPSKCMRRIMDKTSVFVRPQNRHVRRRMSHCHDVANGATALARTLGLNEALAFAAGIGHDVGHTPFGHNGETFIRTITGKQFRHEKFGVVILQKLERKGRGLNLTHQVLDAILKHSRGRGFFSTDPTVTPEGNLIPLADSIGYLFADANDVFKKTQIMSLDDHPKIAEHLAWFGAKQRERTYRCIEAICRESAEKGRVSFSGCEEALRLNALKTLMYDEVYFHLHPYQETEWLARCYEKLQKMHLDADPAVVLALMTDDEVITVADSENFHDWRELKLMAIGELLEGSSGALSTLDFLDTDLEW